MNNVPQALQQLAQPAQGVVPSSKLGGLWTAVSPHLSPLSNVSSIANNHMSMMGTGVSMTNTLHSMLKGLAPAAAAQAVQTAAQNGVQAMSSLGSSLGSSGLGTRIVPAERHGQHLPGVPRVTELLGRTLQGVLERLCLRQLLIQPGQRSLTLHDVVLGRHVTQGAHHDAATSVRVVDMIEVGGDPEAVPVTVDGRLGSSRPNVTASTCRASHVSRSSSAAPCRVSSSVWLKLLA